MSRLIVCLMGLWVLTGSASSAQADPAPYIYYFSDILSAFIIERADGTDSRKIGQGIIPPDHNSIEFVSWSSSGRWFVYSSYRIGSNSSFSSERDPIQVGIFSADGKTHILLSDDTTADFGFAWSPIDDHLFLSYRRESISYIRVIDPSLNRDIIDEQPMQQPVICYRWKAANCRWNDDGTQVSFVGSSGLYDLQVATGVVTKRLSFNRYFENNMTLNDRLTFIDGDEVIVHDLTTQAEWRYPAPISEAGIRMEILWNPQSTAAIVKYPILNASSLDSLYFWLVLGEETLVPLLHPETAENPCFFIECMTWSPDGNRVLISGNSQLWIISVPTYDLLTISYVIDYYASHNLPFWWDETHVVFSSNDHDSSTLLRLNVQDGSTETLPYLAYSMIRSPSRSLDGQYLSFGKQIHDVVSSELVAQSRLSTNVAYQDTFWNPDGQPWVLQSAYNLYSCCRDHSYEIVHLDGSFTRELTSCYGLGCAGWLPRHIEPFLSPESSPHPIIPAPMHWTTFNRWMENFAWNADYTQIKIITLLNYGDPNQYRISILDAETQQFIRPVKDFFCANRCSYRWENDPYAPFTLAPGESVINKAATLQVTREEDEETYTIFDLQTGAVVSTWQSFGDNSFRWVGDTLFESSSYDKNICYRHLHPSVSQNRFIEPLGCSFSNDGRYALLTSPRAMQRSRLIDTHSGETVEVNFYGEMGSFSMDGHSIALASKGFITFWDVEDLMATGR